MVIGVKVVSDVCQDGTRTKGVHGHPFNQCTFALERGSVKKIRWSLLKQFLIPFIVICTASAGFTENLTGAQILSPPSPPFASHEIPDLPVSLPLFKKQHQRRTT
ncbi:hypothetical protein L2E82_18444 [Cichorium intybus]|uniref:Uncharacterized protein n=1 Tax=Cichorium intybus TaxID=13427 RepID=A0ACB9FAV1_CICIN|nr:hypothetical protein L2E82_18444 [Cichorium intybus]